jgi:hypothetical protein
MPAPTIPMGWSPEHRSSMSPVKHVIGAECPPSPRVLTLAWYGPRRRWYTLACG